MFLFFWCFLGATSWMVLPPPDSIAACRKAGWSQKESFTQRFKHFVRLVKPSKKHPVTRTLDGHYSHSRNLEVLGKTGCTLFVFPRTALLNCNFWTFPSCSLWRQPTHTRYKFGWKPIQTELLHTVKLLDWLGKAYLKSATAAMLQTGSGTQACFPATFTCLMNVILEEFQRNIMSCLPKISVPCSKIAAAQPTTAAQIHSS